MKYVEWRCPMCKISVEKLPLMDGFFVIRDLTEKGWKIKRKYALKNSGKLICKDCVNELLNRGWANKTELSIYDKKNFDKITKELHADLDERYKIKEGKIENGKCRE